MKRNRLVIPDAINCSLSSEFTQVPNDLLRNPEISAKAKAILCLLLSNKEGWHSHLNIISTMMKEGRDAIQNGLSELEKFGYLTRIRYRDKETKVWKGSFWAYTDMPGYFIIDETLEMLDNKGFEPQPGFPVPDKPHVENPVVYYNNININNTNKKTSSLENTEKNQYITPSQFEEFWHMYPRKVDKGKAKAAWNKVCSRKNDRPTWRCVKRAIIKQKESERWQDKKFIQHPTTWLNKYGWLNDPAEMKSFKKSDKPIYYIRYGIRWNLKEDGEYRNNNGEKLPHEEYIDEKGKVSIK